ncbi:hypothetical protein [Caulobacter endophyticus]|uniref:hypothetical protein n=1 Tax=Caulobacter endophyticus TaxID=2172652 RepID=UPI0011B26C46|nr:hypothetical protein [Caulobacter endophyticus]
MLTKMAIFTQLFWNLDPMSTPEQVAVAPKPKFGAIAMIDDGLQPMRFDLIPESEREAVRALLKDADVLEDLAMRGMDASAVGAAPDDAIDALTNPALGHGLAYAKISDVSASTVRMIDRRQMMRQIADSIRNTDGCEVKELGPDDDLADIARFDVVFIDYYLDDMETDGTRAEQIATNVQGLRKEGQRQQIVLMSTFEGVRAMRSQFRKTASIDAASFAFVAKRDLDEDWKVKAHLEMLARGMQHSSTLGDYISAVKKSARDAAETLSATIDDLDIGDFAYIQRIALHADGHPLGDYLSWLLSSHLSTIAFEGELREKQRLVDAMEFEDGPLSPSEPSTAVAALYHDALFARNLGPLSGHPRAEPGSELANVPFVQLGDVFLTDDKSRAVVVLSPDCDLAFSTHEKRQPDLNLGVILVFGDPNSVTSEIGDEVNSSTEGMLHDTEVYRIDWRFNTFQTVRLGDLQEFLNSLNFDVSKRDRLRPIYSLKLQHELGSHLMRVGPPVMPPVARHAKSKIHYRRADEVVTEDLNTDDLVIAHFKRQSKVRLTPSLVSKLKHACGEVRDDLAVKLETMPTNDDKERKAKRDSASKVEALENQIRGSDVWTGLLGDHPLPAVGQSARLRGSIYLATAGGWTFPNPQAVMLVVGEETADGSAETSATEDALSTEAEVSERHADQSREDEPLKPAKVERVAAAKVGKAKKERP